MRALFVAASLLTAGWACAETELWLNFALSPAEVRYGESSVLFWQAPEGARCVASGAWAGQKSNRGEERVNNVRRHETFYLTCTKNGATVKRRVTVKLKGLMI